MVKPKEGDGEEAWRTYALYLEGILQANEEMFSRVEKRITDFIATVPQLTIAPVESKDTDSKD